jgi:hypothetical protein
MYQSLPHLIRAFLGNNAAHPERDLAGSMSSVSSYLGLHIVRWVGLACFVILGLVAITSPLEEKQEACHPCGSDESVKALWSQPGSHAHLARLRSGSIHRSHRHPLAVPKIVSAYDSNDDDAQEDYDDDDAWDDPNGFDDAHGPIIACLGHLVPDLILPDFQSVPACTPAPSPRFLTLQRIRC